MNAKRRNKVERALELLREAATEEREAYDNLPESLQYTVKGQLMECTADALEDAISNIEEWLLIRRAK